MGFNEHVDGQLMCQVTVLPKNSDIIFFFVEYSDLQSFLVVIRFFSYLQIIFFLKD